MRDSAMGAHTGRWSRALVLGGAALVAMAGAASALEVTDPVQVESIIIDFAFEPDITVPAGSSLRWSNSDPAAHTVTSVDGHFDSGAISSGGAFGVTFDAAGVFAYVCSIHPSMTGTVTVTDAFDTRTVPDPDSAPTMTTMLRLATLHDRDPLGVGGPAVTLLVPDGWGVEGGPVWRHQFANLATFEGRVMSPDQLLGVEYFPFFPQVWQQGGLPFFPPGSNYLGHEVREPITDAATFLEQLVLPAYRGGFEPRVIDRMAMPEVAELFARSNLPGTKVVAERVLTEHFVQGERMLEEFTVVLAFTVNPAIAGRVTWIPQQLFAIRAPEAVFETAKPLLQTIATSPVVDLRWYAAYDHVLGLALQNGLEAIRAAGAASRIIAETNAEITDIIIRGYQEREAVNDRIFDAISQTIRGVETYNAPSGLGTLELPNGYSHVYGSPEGNIILSNEPAFDPVSAFPDQTWEILEVQG